MVINPLSQRNGSNKGFDPANPSYFDPSGSGMREDDPGYLQVAEEQPQETYSFSHLQDNTRVKFVPLKGSAEGQYDALSPNGDRRGSTSMTNPMYATPPVRKLNGNNDEAFGSAAEGAYNQPNAESRRMYQDIPASSTYDLPHRGRSTQQDHYDRISHEQVYHTPEGHEIRVPDSFGFSES